jgi:hypothetical protein
MQAVAKWRRNTQDHKIPKAFALFDLNDLASIPEGENRK